MTSRVLRLGLALVVAMLGLPGAAPVRSAASTATLGCPGRVKPAGGLCLQGDGSVATTRTAAVCVTGSGSGGTFTAVDTAQIVIAVLVAGLDGPAATKIDHYSGGTSAGSFTPPRSCPTPKLPRR